MGDMLVDVPIVPELLARQGVTVSGEIIPLVRREGRLVARVETAAGPVALKISGDPGAFAAEEAAVRRLAGAGLPVARVIAHAEGPPACLVLTWVEGTALSSASPPETQRAAGALLRQVHRLGAGAGATFGGQPGWEVWMAGWLNHALAWWSSVASVDEAVRGGAWAWYQMLKPQLGTRGDHLMLFDGRPEHILVAGDGRLGLIDVSELRAGDAAMDLAVLAVEDPDLLDGALAGYGPECAGFESLIPFYVFLRRLARAEWYQRFGTEAEMARVLALVEGTTWAS
jgi:aminoglycoside phosphotransferase (APT) family kinase protein